MRMRFFVGLLLFILGAISVLVLGSIAPKEAIGQATFVIGGIIAYIGAQLLPHRFWRHMQWLLYGLIIVLLIVTLVRGKVAKGASRWLPIGPFRMQISELAKPSLVLTLAAFI